MTTDPGSYGRSLTDREHQVLRLLADGHTRAEIAQQIGATKSGINYTLSCIYRKLDANGEAQAVSIGYRWGLLDVAEGLGDDLAMLRQWRAAGWRISLVRIGEGT